MRWPCWLGHDWEPWSEVKVGEKTHTATDTVCALYHQTRKCLVCNETQVREVES